jgi:hypothetical protein
MLGGPLGTLAGNAISIALTGKEGATQDDLLLALQDPASLLKLKETEYNFKIKMAELGIDEQKIDQLDRDSARQRESKLALAGIRDYIPSALAILLTVGFYSVIGCLFFIPIQSTAKEIADIMLGSLGAAWLSMINYYFGSSKGSAEKNKIIHALKNN